MPPQFRNGSPVDPGAAPPPAAAPRYEASQQYAAPSPNQPRVSRRSLLRGAAGVGAVGLAAAAGAGATVALTQPRSEEQVQTPPANAAAWPPSVMAGPLFIYVPDTTSGLVHIYGGTNETHADSPTMVSQVLRAVAQ